MLQAAGSSTPAEMFQFPVAALYPIGLQSALPLQLPVTTNGSSAQTTTVPSNTPSSSSANNGMGVAGVGVAGMSTDSLTVPSGLKRPLSESQSAPGLPSGGGGGGEAGDTLMLQLQLQQQVMGNY